MGLIDSRGGTDRLKPFYVPIPRATIVGSRAGSDLSIPTRVSLVTLAENVGPPLLSSLGNEQGSLL